ncbi:MAG: sensor histidine kinase, partial [Deltaproteobacteria bacterium]|nr:sensor histidine kinase [Deltaproteobacteria bacterium]
PAVLALRESEERLRKILELSPLSMAIVSMHGTIEYINHRAVETFGYLPEDIPDMEQWWLKAYPDAAYRAEVVARWLDLFAQALAGNREIARREYRVTCKNGTIKTMVIFGAIVTDKVFVMFEDITERKLSEEALQQSERYLQEAQEVAGLGTYNYNLITGKWEDSAILSRIFGIDASYDRTFTGWAHLIHPADRQMMVDYINHEVIGKRRSFNKEYRVIRPCDGTERWVHGRGELKFDDHGCPVSMIGTIMDITGRKLVQEEVHRLNTRLETLVAERTSELVRSNRDLASFCYAISHELRAPVARLKGLSQAFQEELTENPTAALHCAERITIASDQLQRVIDSVLELSRLSQLSFVVHPLDLSAMAREIAATIVSENPGRQVELAIAADIAASGDPGLVRLCLENLLGNAVKYSVRQPVARIAFGRDAVSGALFVRDNGIGFDMANADKLFEPFIRLHREEEFAGSGIGLATVQRIIERHGGRIWAEAAPDQGATFFFTLAPVQGGQV